MTAFIVPTGTQQDERVSSLQGFYCPLDTSISIKQLDRRIWEAIVHVAQSLDMHVVVSPGGLQGLFVPLWLPARPRAIADIDQERGWIGHQCRKLLFSVRRGIAERVKVSSHKVYLLTRFSSIPERLLPQRLAPRVPCACVARAKDCAGAAGERRVT